MTDSIHAESTLKSRVEAVLERLDIKQAHLAKALNMSAGSISKILSGQTKRPDYAFFAGMHVHFGVNPQWLADGTGGMLEETNPAPDATTKLHEGNIPLANQEEPMESGAVGYVLTEMTMDQLLGLIKRIKSDAHISPNKRRAILADVAIEIHSRHERKSGMSRLGLDSSSE